MSTGRWRALGAAAVVALALAVLVPGIAFAKDKVKAGIAGTTLTITGTGGAETIVLRLHAGDSSVLDIDVGSDGIADLTFKRDKFDHIVVDARGGDDSVLIDQVNGVFTDTELTTINGGDGNDTLVGGSAAETFSGGDGNDTIAGRQGNDTAFMGAGNDTFTWNPGDGNDIVDGQDGTDTLVFNGANINERFDISANGGRVRFTRDIASISIDLDGVDLLDLNTVGGADIVTVNDLTGTDLTAVSVDLAGVLGGATGDGAVDTVFVNGTAGADAITVTGGSVTGLSAQVDIDHADGSDLLIVNGLAGNDTLTPNFPNANLNVTLEGGIDTDTVIVNGGNGGETFTATATLDGARVDRATPAPFSAAIGTTTENLVVNLNGGNDTFSATGNLAALIAITVDGGAGNDIINGSNGADVLRGGDDNDTIDGQQGSDVAFLGAGDDTFRWDPGDGSDSVEGQDGTDTLVFNGANINERFDVSANGARVRFTRDIASIVMDLDDTELIDINAIGGADIITVNDLTGTDVTAVNADLAGPLGGGTGDGQADTVVVNGTAGADAIAVSGAGTSAQVTGLAAQVNIRDAEAANDALVVDARADIDTVTATALPAGVIRLTVDGGPGNDVALLSPGDDVFRWDPGDGSDTVEGAGGTDRLVFNGANISEQFDVLANGARVSFTRNVASIAMDLDDVEVIDVNALGGADIVTVGNLGGTDVTRVDANLAGVLGGATGDGQPDTVDVTGTDGADVVVVAGDSSGASVFGLAAAVQITGADAGIDVQSVHALGGDDVIDASGVAAGAISLHLFGGDGDDVLLGGDGDDSLFGEAGDDVLIGNGGNDILDGGPGSNIVIQ